MTTVTLNNGRTAETGCYVDGHWGIYSTDHMMDQCAGFVDFDTSEYPSLADERDGKYEEDAMCDRFDVRMSMSDDLEEALNAATPEGFLWHWCEGEFFLSPYCGRWETNGECDDDTCACHIG